MSQPHILPFVNPATGEQFGQVAMAAPDEITLAHKEMRQAFQVWRRKPLSERIRILRQFQAEIIDSMDEISAVINQDTGKSRQDGWVEVNMTVDRMHQYYKLAPKWLARRRVPPGLYMFKQYYTEPHPFGVVAVIGPWNYPFDLCVPPMCSALLAGNTVLLKPSEVAPAVGVMIEKLIQRVPELAPFVRVLHGDGAVGAQIVASRPDLIFLTGSTATGFKIAQAAAETLTPFIYELGGKDPMIVFDSADVAAAAKWGTWGAFYNTGQTCMGIERVYVQSGVYDEFVTAVLAQTRQIKIGYTTETDSQFDMGPLTFERQVHIVKDHLQDALDKGARILTGGELKGLFMEPTILVDVDHSMKVMREETFGPIMPIMKFDDESEAIWLANDCDYGLSAAVWSGDMRQAKRVAHRLDVGSVNINDAISHYPVSLLPFGGVKLSGNARTHGKEEILQFTQMRSYAIGAPPNPLDIATVFRSPGHYRLGKAITRFAFGVTPRQRLEPITELLGENGLDDKVGQAIKVTGAVAVATAVILGLLRSRK
ncbi:MAG: aldehyde dehydrogenase family protein [Ardenticatenaceae bacterium]|nr:aldehyde dehydrogenase family protein [Ardenticatenaceae bacterium]